MSRLFVTDSNAVDTDLYAELFLKGRSFEINL